MINSGSALLQGEMLSSVGGSGGGSDSLTSHIKLHSMSDIRLSFKTTYILHHLP